MHVLVANKVDQHSHTETRTLVEVLRSRHQALPRLHPRLRSRVIWGAAAKHALLALLVLGGAGTPVVARELLSATATYALVGEEDDTVDSERVRPSSLASMTGDDLQRALAGTARVVLRRSGYLEIVGALQRCVAEVQEEVVRAEACAAAARREREAAERREAMKRQREAEERRRVRQREEAKRKQLKTEEDRAAAATHRHVGSLRAVGEHRIWSCCGADIGLSSEVECRKVLGKHSDNWTGSKVCHTVTCANSALSAVRAPRD